MSMAERVPRTTQTKLTRHPSRIVASPSGGFAAALLAPSRAAQQYPAKLVRVVTGSTPGGGADVTARQIVPRLAEVLKAQIIVDNRPGVAGMIANESCSGPRPTATRCWCSRARS